MSCRRAKSQLTSRKCRLCTQQGMTLNAGNSVVIRQSVASHGSEHAKRLRFVDQVDKIYESATDKWLTACAFEH